VFITGNSGFPKSHNIGKAVDKLKGNEREWISESPFKASDEAEQASAGKSQSGRTTHPDITKGTSEWEGWGTALKPALEPITVARKPLSEKTVAENVLKWGTGGINIDGSRVDFVSEEDKKESTTKNQHEDFGTKPMTGNNTYGDYSMIQPKNYNPTGRFPANLIHDGSDEVVELFPNTKSGGGLTKRKNKDAMFDFGQYYEREEISDSGSAARFFYCAKASKSERNRGVEDGNKHPTVKPLDLMEYLVKLVSKENAIVLDPFAGSGSTLLACKNLNRKYIGIEREEDYIKIINARLQDK